jgi:hypothetical protein
METMEPETNRWLGANRRLHAELRLLSRLAGVPLPPGPEPFGDADLAEFVAAVGRQLVYDGRAELFRQRKNGGNNAFASRWR